MERVFPTSQDSGMRRTTTILLAVVGAVAALMALAAVSTGDDDALVPTVAILAFYLLVAAIVVGSSLRYSPKAYRITDQHLSIERGVAPRRIPVASIESVERLHPDDLSGTWRVAGIGGMFCNHGWFRNRKLGEFYMSATRSDRLVLIRTAKQRFVLTPDSPDEFVEALTSLRT